MRSRISATLSSWLAPAGSAPRVRRWRASTSPRRSAAAMGRNTGRCCSRSWPARNDRERCPFPFRFVEWRGAEGLGTAAQTAGLRRGERRGMMGLVGLALRRPYTAAVAALLILMMGGLSLTRMIVDIFPIIDIPVVLVAWNYPGLAAEDMERRVVIISERAYSTTVDGISRLESQSIPGTGIQSRIRLKWRYDSTTYWRSQ